MTILAVIAAIVGLVTEVLKLIFNGSHQDRVDALAKLRQVPPSQK